jgi:hypothetical protein
MRRLRVFVQLEEPEEEGASLTDTDRHQNTDTETLIQTQTQTRTERLSAESLARSKTTAKIKDSKLILRLLEEFQSQVT